MKNPFNFFDAIFCINLDKRQDRWTRCIQQFQTLGIEQKVQRFSAIKVKNVNNYSHAFIGRCGCSLSHFEVCKLAKEKQYKNYLVLEDDFEFTLDKDTTFNLLTKLTKEIPINWDMFYLGANLTNDYGIFPIEEFSDNLFKLKSCHTTHAMAFNSSFYDLFLKNAPDINSIYSWINEYQVIDAYLGKYILNNINCFINKTNIVNQAADFSDIDNIPCNYISYINNNFNNYKNLLYKNDNL